MSVIEYIFAVYVVLMAYGCMGVIVVGVMDNLELLQNDFFTQRIKLIIGTIWPITFLLLAVSLPLMLTLMLLYEVYHIIVYGKGTEE